MQFGFDTESIKHGEAALLLYAMYKSRGEKSSLNGLETWERCNAYIRAAVLKSSTTAEFVQQFCRKASISKITPMYLKTDGIVKINELGTLASGDSLYEYKTSIFENQELLDLFTNESIYIVMLVRERIQRDKYQNESEELNNED